MAFTSTFPVSIRFHQVKAEENLSAIAAKYQIEPEEVKKQNPDAKFEPGEMLVLTLN
ncbi:MAG: LysM domain-containing protein [Candidatus Margulisiibacteriota bacterium]